MPEEMPPKKPVKSVLEVRLSGADEATVRQLAEQRASSLSEILSDAVKRGLPALVKEHWDAYLFKKGTKKAEIIDLIDSIPQAKYDEAIAYLKGLKHD